MANLVKLVSLGDHLARDGQNTFRKSTSVRLIGMPAPV